MQQAISLSQHCGMFSVFPSAVIATASFRLQRPANLAGGRISMPYDARGSHAAAQTAQSAIFGRRLVKFGYFACIFFRNMHQSPLTKSHYPPHPSPELLVGWLLQRVPADSAMCLSRGGCRFSPVNNGAILRADGRTQRLQARSLRIKWKVICGYRSFRMLLKLCCLATQTRNQKSEAGQILTFSGQWVIP